jgi:glycine dehydrogenase subunit 2
VSELIFDLSQKGRFALSQMPKLESIDHAIPESLMRKERATLPEVSELDVVRHFTRLSQKNFSIDTHFYPLGSCTMKYNPRGVHRLAMHPGFLNLHPLLPETHNQGFLACMHHLQILLADIVGMEGVSLTPMAGAQGEFTGVSMIKAYHEDRGDFDRTEMLVPDAAHGTNPSTATQCGMTVKEIPTKANGDVDLDALKKALGPQTAGIMLTNPSTLGVFEQEIETIAALVHAAGGLLYYDGANLNAILGKVRPGDMGFDVMHLNLHKTFATPHGGGGPGSGPVAANKRLLKYLPTPIVMKEGEQYRWSEKKDRSESIGRLSCFMGNAGILLRAYFYIRTLGREGLIRAGELATLNANYLMVRLQEAGFELAFPDRKATHEFVVTLKKEKKASGITATDFSKRLLDYGFHAPTMYFPMLVPECLLIEPTETESKQTLDAFVDAMISIRKEIEEQPELLKQAPHTMPIKRLDDVKAARELDLVYSTLDVIASD